MKGRGTIFLGVIRFGDFGCGRAELGVIVSIFSIEIFGFVMAKW